MADTQTRSEVLKYTAEFADGDDRIFSVPDPKDPDDLPELLGSLQSFLVEKGIFVGDRASSPIAKLRDAKVVRTTTTTLDLGNIALLRKRPPTVDDSE